MSEPPPRTPLVMFKGGLGFWWVAVGEPPSPLMYGPFVDKKSASVGLKVIRLGLGEREPGDLEMCVTALISYLKAEPTEADDE